VRARALVLLLPVLVAACDAPTIPPRTEVYRYAAEGGLVFRWPAGATVRLFVAGEGDLPRQLQRWTDAAADMWNASVLYDDFRLTRTGRLHEADVVLRWSQTPLPVSVPDGAVCTPPGGQADTMFCFEAPRPEASPDAPPARLVTLPIRDAAPGAEGRVRAVITVLTWESADTLHARRLVAHEVGHAVGIWNHSPAAADLMFGGILSADALTRADRATVQILYRTPPNVAY
jgi:hypothetical protein